MTGREKIEAAFSTDGVLETPVVIPYEDIYIRDHWEALTSKPWWHAYTPDIELQIAWRKEVFTKINQDWLLLPSFYSRNERQYIQFEERSDGIYQIDRKNMKEHRLEKPRVSGWSASSIESIHPKQLPNTVDDLDRLLPPPTPFNEHSFHESGRADLAHCMLAEFSDLFPICRVNSPLWSCYDIWGFEGMMETIATNPELIMHACERYLEYSLHSVHEAAVLGAAGIWIEECLTDMISPKAFKLLSVPYVTRLIQEIRALGMKSIYYFCGNPAGKLDFLLATGTDALALEESKKGFTIDIVEIAKYVGGRCVLFGNLDAIHVLQNGSIEELELEISRQLSARRFNSNRFIMSLGSPVTPETPVDKVRLYCDLTRKLATLATDLSVNQS
jgi:hypothetical protein